MAVVKRNRPCIRLERRILAQVKRTRSSALTFESSTKGFSGEEEPLCGRTAKSSSTTRSKLDASDTACPVAICRRVGIVGLAPFRRGRRARCLLLVKTPSDFSGEKLDELCKRQADLIDPVGVPVRWTGF